MKWLLFSFIISGISSMKAEVTWPSGAYGLPKAKTGCPQSEGRAWKEGWRKQDLEDDKSWNSQISVNSHMEATLVNNNINRTFCMKVDYGISKREWPKGFYCVYKSSDSTCSNLGMKEGYVKWDDEDDDNNNKKYGILPDGTYDKNTIIKYCCQDEGHWSNSVELPADQPFYLMPYKSSTTKYPKCQLVKWAMSWLEYIQYHTSEHANADESGGSHGFMEFVGGKPKIYYCYYKGCRYKMTENSGSFASPNSRIHIYPQFQFCSWLVTVSKTYVVLLNVTYLNVPNCDENFVKIFDGVDETAPLLKTYCGSNATSRSTIVSSTNNMYMILKSGTYLKDAKVRVGFEANYATQIKPTEISTLLTSVYMTTTMKTTDQQARPNSTPKPKLANENNKNLSVTYIIIPVIVGVAIILVVAVIVIYMRRLDSNPTVSSRM